MQRLVCPSCNADIPAESINVEKTIAVCPNCDMVFDFSFIGGGKPKKAAKRHPVAAPRRFTVQESERGFDITWAWFDASALFLLFFTVIWNFFVFIFVSLSFSDGMGFPFPFNLIPLVHMAVGIGLAYYSLSLLVNRTRVRVADDGTITVRTYPIPHPWRDKTTYGGQMEQIFVKKHVSHSSKGRRSVSYEVVARMTDVSDETLVSGLENSEFALYIEQELERYLGIPDEEVAGAYQP